ncbi:trans-aconitate 2-methyltransferase [Ampelomyces quisqualis]|uniref:Trans-aconitate 2-methyltransferase n=1 Tax=Ampelomyces quisqualis TaxID=50730 RepID=A0A6A5QB69_AMPQU|nr:trans-aconitate 2-methyltransferase [Ampelomyces quisqualis]
MQKCSGFANTMLRHRSVRSIACVQKPSHHMTSPTRAMTSATASKAQNDWSADQYLKFKTQRTRPVHDLISQVVPHMTAAKPRIYDLGCGPGNSTQALHAAFPHGEITGIDSSPDMLDKARAALPRIEFVQGDVSAFNPKDEPDVLFSNAVFHWVRRPARIPTLVRLFQRLTPGGVMAMQVPDNYDEPSHAAMRVAAKMSGQVWSAAFSTCDIGNVDGGDRPDLDPVEPAAHFYNALVPHAALVNVWRTTYLHVLDDERAIVEWVEGTGLQPFLNLIDDEQAKARYVNQYARLLKERYPKLADGKVLLAYPRLFVVAVRQ